MACEFTQFCSCGRAGYAVLQQRIDACAALGRSYEFQPCRMPPGCTPAEAAVGFWRDPRGYFIYFVPEIRYQGPDGRLAQFFQSGIQRFPSFEALTQRLQLLDRDTPTPDQSPPLFRSLERTLGAVVLGQEEAVEAAAFKLCGHVCKKEPKRPLSLILYGPTGVGKSELGKAVAPALNQCCPERSYRFVWTELNTFTQAHSAYRLTGAPPGYVGYDDAPVFEAVRANPYTVFMFDELEKAHPEVLKVFMSILDEGRCTARREGLDGSRELDFRHCVFLFTTNADLSRHRTSRLGFAPPEPPAPPTVQSVSTPASLAQRLFLADEAARQALVRQGALKEIAGRFSGLIGFHDLDAESRAAVTVKQIAALGQEYGLEIIQVSPALAAALTPSDALSLRSTVGVLEGVLTPLFLACAQRWPGLSTFRLDGPLEALRLVPCAPYQPSQCFSSSTVPDSLSRR